MYIILYEQIMGNCRLLALCDPQSDHRETTFLKSAFWFIVIILGYDMLVNNSVKTGRVHPECIQDL